jgi:multisubunit Na+/H+ antiporter MnhC subunit
MCAAYVSGRRKASEKRPLLPACATNVQRPGGISDVESGARATETLPMGRILLGIVIGIAIVIFLLVQCTQAIF